MVQHLLGVTVMKLMVQDVIHTDNTLIYGCRRARCFAKYGKMLLQYFQREAYGAEIQKKFMGKNDHLNTAVISLVPSACTTGRYLW